MPPIELNWPPPPPVHALPDFPLSFQELQHAWEGFTPRWEYHRVSFSEWMKHLLDQVQGDIGTLQPHLTDPASQRPIPELLQRHFYWSATCFVRCFHLFLGYLVLDARGLSSWAVVTGYYSRFYFAKAIMNLWLGSWVRAEVKTAKGAMKERPLLLYTGTGGVRLLDGYAASFPNALHARDSHDSWWSLLTQLQHVTDLPEDLNWVLQDRAFGQERRQALNYSEVWMKGFPELEWFDQSIEQMLSHAHFFRPRPDRDFTDMNRFFREHAPEDADVADFYTDEAQPLWNSVLSYLKALDQLPFQQNFITREKLIVLSERALAELLPDISRGIRQTLEEGT